MSANPSRDKFFLPLVLLVALLSIHPIARAELIVHLAFDGNLDDEVGPNEGEMIDAGLAPIDDPEYVDGIDGTEEGALRFHEDRVVVYDVTLSEGTLPLTVKPEFSIAMWVRLGPGGQNDRRVFSESTNADNNPLFNIGTDNTGATGKLDQYIRNAQTFGHKYSEQEPFVLDEWHHIAWTTDADGETRVYVDGLEDPVNFDYTRQTWNHTFTTIGGILRGSTCCLFSGDIDDVRLYDHVLSAEEVLELTCNPNEVCPVDGDTTCGDISITGPLDMSEGRYTVQATGSVDDSGDTILYGFRAEKRDADPAVVLQAGPISSDSHSFDLDAGTWDISVTVDDSPCCDDVAAGAVCSDSVTVISTEPRLVAHFTFDGHMEDDAGPNEGRYIDGAALEVDPTYVEGVDGEEEGAIHFEANGMVVYDVANSGGTLPMTNHRN